MNESNNQGQLFEALLSSNDSVVAVLGLENQTNVTTLSEDFDGYRVPVAVEVLMYVMYITAAVAAVGGNGIVVYLVIAYQRMRTVTNFFIVNLAIGDILMAILCIPFGFVSNLLLQYWPFGAVMCVVVSYSQAVSVFISAYTLIAISIDRYIAILYPLRPRMSKLHAKVTIASVWLVALLTPLPTALLSRLSQPEAWVVNNVTDKFICTEEWSDYTHRYYYSMALMILQYFFPLTVLVYTYTRIAIVVWGKRTPGEAEDSRDRRMAASKRKMVKMMIVCVCAFTLCWLPFNTLVVVGDQYPEIFFFPNINYIWFACHWLSMSHAAYNPLIFIWMNSRFRAGFRYVVSLVPGVPRMTELPDFLPHCSHATMTMHSQATIRSKVAAPTLKGATNNSAPGAHNRLRTICTKDYGTSNCPKTNNRRSMTSSSNNKTSPSSPRHEQQPDQSTMGLDDCSLTNCSPTSNSIATSLERLPMRPVSPSVVSGRVFFDQSKLAKIELVVVLAYTLCWLPLNALIVVADHEPRVWKLPFIYFVWFICHWLATSHGMMNPLIYSTMNANFKTGFTQIYRQILCCGLKGRRDKYSLSLRLKYKDDDSVIRRRPPSSRESRSLRTEYEKAADTLARSGGGDGDKCTYETIPTARSSSPVQTRLTWAQQSFQ